MLVPVGSPARPGKAGPPGRPKVEGPPGERLQLVEPEVSRAKLEQELAAWSAQTDLYRRRGWVLLHHQGLMVEVAFVAPVTFPTGSVVPVVTACIRLDYTNYDLEPPSLRFIDVWTREPATPLVQPKQLSSAGELQNLMPGLHPDTGLPFLCLPGVLEYHTYPQHSGDLWLVGHRAQGAGRLAVVCERVWQAMGRHLGLAVQFQATVGIGHNVEALRQEAGQIGPQAGSPAPDPGAEVQGAPA